MIEREVAHQRTARVGRHFVTRTAKQFRQRQIQRLALDVPQRNVDGRERQRENAAGPALPRCRAQFCQHRFDFQRVHTHGQLAQRLHGNAQRTGQCAAEEGRAQAFDTGVGAHGEGDEIACRAFRRRAVGQRFVVRQFHD